MSLLTCWKECVVTSVGIYSDINISHMLRKKEEKNTRGMPWHLKATKDVASCDKLRVDASSLRSEDFRMGQPTRLVGYPAMGANAEN